MKTRLLLFLFLNSFLAWTQIPTANIREYLFNNADLTDTGIYGNNLVVRNNENNFSYTASPDGTSMSAMQLNSASFDGGSIPSNLNSLEWSYSFWIKTNPISPGNPEQEIMLMLNNPSGLPVRGIFISQGANNVMVNVSPTEQTNGSNSGNATPYFTNSSSIADNQWHHIAVVIEAIDDSSMNRTFTTTIYIDGTQDSSNSRTYFFNSFSPKTIVINDGAMDYYLGRFSGSNFVGSLDDIRIYDRAVTQSEISQLASLNPIPSGPIVSHSFTNGSLINDANPGVGDLVQTGSSSSFVTGIQNDAGSALNVNSDSFVSSSVVTAQSRTFTASFWINTSTQTTNEDLIWRFISPNFATTVQFFRTIEPTGEVRFTWTAGNTVGQNIVPGITTGNWHHITIVASEVNFNTTRYRLFLDGSFNADLTGNSTGVTGNANNFLSYNVEISPFNGYSDEIDNIRIYNRALSDADVLTLFNENTVLSTDQFQNFDADISIFPNPTSNVLNIDANNLQIENVQIFDMLGKQIINSTNTEINVSNLKTGIYLLKAKTTLGEVVKRFIKQ